MRAILPPAAFTTKSQNDPASSSTARLFDDAHGPTGDFHTRLCYSLPDGGPNGGEDDGGGDYLLHQPDVARAHRPLDAGRDWNSLQNTISRFRHDDEGG